MIAGWIGNGDHPYTSPIGAAARRARGTGRRDQTMRRVKVFHGGELVGTLAAPTMFRPRSVKAAIENIPTSKLWWSRSPLYTVKPGDLQLELSGTGEQEEVLVVASDQLTPFDISCLIGFEPIDGAGRYAPDNALLNPAADSFDAIIRRWSM